MRDYIDLSEYFLVQGARLQVSALYLHVYRPLQTSNCTILSPVLPPITDTMDQMEALGFRHTQSPSDRFLSVFSPPSDAAISSSLSSSTELTEHDVFYTDFSEPSPQSGNRYSFRRPDKFGILVALPESHGNPDVVIQKQNFRSSTSDIPSIPKPGNKLSQSMPPIRRFQQSAPVNVPMMNRKARNGNEVEMEESDGDDEEMLPPHEMVARGSWMNEKKTFSVLEGVGRTLKGRDLRQVRNAVLRHTGFLD